MLSRKVVSLFLISFFLVVTSVFGQSSQVQFGKNNVRYDQLDQFYESHRFDVWHNLDPNDPDQMEYLRQVVDNLEGARDWMGGSKISNHSIEKRIPIFFCKTHSCMESLNLVGGFLPEGVGAFVELERKRMVLKADFSRPLGRAIGVHELFHEFQFDIYNPNIIQRVVSSVSLPNGYFEGCAEFIAGLYDPHTRDDIRRREQRAFASNPKSLPTWAALNNGRINPYTMWSMIPEFLEDKFSGGVAFCTQPLKNKVGLGEFVYDLTKGELGNPDINSEKFDQHNRHYWGKELGFEVDRINRPKPYEENDNFRGWTVTPYGHPYPMLSPRRSPDGSQIAAFTFQKNGVALVKYDIPQENVYISKEDREKAKKNGNKKLNQISSGLSKIKNLTPQLPPVPWVYLIVEGFETWPFNGFDQDWWQDPDWIVKVKDSQRDLDNSRQMLARFKNTPEKYKAKDHALMTKVLEDNAGSLENDLEVLKQIPDVNKIAFFARINRDHALVIIDANSGEVLKKIEFELPGFKLDQAFSPSFSPDGKKVYFSAARNITRDLYVADLESEEVVNLTNDERFDTAPAVSPDGSQAVYVGSDGDFQHLFLLHLADGRKEQLTFGGFNDSSPSWSDDGSTLVYTSDEADMIWNLYTFDLATRTVSQRTEFIGEVKTPLFARGSLNKVYYVVFHDDDQYRDQIYQNYEIFATELKKTIRQYTAVDKGEPNIFAFNPNRDLFKRDLDSNQLLNPKKPPENWRLAGSSVSIGGGPWGMGGQSVIAGSNILETKRHGLSFIYYGDFKVISYSYLNQEKRTAWQAGTHYLQLPLRFQSFDLVLGYPEQIVLNHTWLRETGVNLFAQYPKNRFNRWEVFSKLYHRGYSFYGIDQQLIDSGQYFFTPTDSEVFQFLNKSGGSNISFGAAYVRDTVLYSNNTQGPFHGNAFRFQVESAPPLGGSFHGYTSVSLDARTYKHLSSGTLFAGSVSAVTTSRANGDFILLGGPQTLRGKPYGSIIGNQAMYASGELRFPLMDAIVLPGDGRNYVGPFRGILFFDAGIARFNDQKLPAQAATSIGGGIQFLPFNFLMTREKGNKWKPSFYITMNW